MARILEQKTDSGLNIIYLGEANGWDKKPEEYIRHCETCQYSDQQRQRLGNCYHRYTCQKCGIQYTVDSSG